MPKGKKATAHDAQVLMQLYDLRREPVMRAARKFMVSEFWPQNYDELKALMFEYGTERNAFARQCLTYWDMAAAMVLHGAIHEDLFFDANNEPYFLFAKLGQYLPQLRKEYIAPKFLTNLEQLANRPKGKERVKHIQGQLAARRAAAAAAKAAKQAQ
ncbi:MAG TPA: hypothetical protein VI488_14940 [Candidatus Angelobacter sp.]